MLNKKILAASIAAAFTFNAHAVVDLADSDTALTIASETTGALNGDGLLDITNAGVVADATTLAGFTVSAGTSKYVRIKLNNAEFDAAAALTAAGVANFSATVSQGGADGDDEVIFEITSTSNDIAASDVLTLDVAAYAVSTTADVTVEYNLYETAADAVNEANSLASQTGALLSVSTGSTGTFATSNDRISTVTSSFLKFQTGVDTATDALDTVLADLGSVDGTLIVAGSTYTPALAAVVMSDLITATQDVVVTGDFSYGTWELNADAACTAAVTVVAAVIATDDASATFPNVGLATEMFLCLEVDGSTETIQKSEYSAELADDEITNDVGEIKYDTTSIEVPYVSTFSGVNQKFFITNYGDTAATYSFEFIEEDGITATNGTEWMGEIPSGEMVTIQASNVVDLANGTRTSAILEIESTDANVAVSTQIVNKDTGGTDTIILN